MKKTTKFRSALLFFISAVACINSYCYSQSSFPKTKTSIVDIKALTCFNGTYGNIINGQSFQQDALTSYKGWQYIAYYDWNRHVCVGRRKLPGGAWEIARLVDYHYSYSKNQENDTHNVISMGLSKNDGTFHLAFDHHGGPLHYRVSDKNILDHPEKVKWASFLFKPVINYLEEGKPVPVITYPAFISTPQGDLLFAFRNGISGNGDCLVGRYDGSTGKWENPHIYISGQGDYTDPFAGLSKTRNAYLNGFSYDRNDQLHISWTWREIVSSFGNRDICYAYSKDNGSSWYNDKNEEVASYNGIAELKPINAFTPNIVVKDLNRGWGMMNQQSQAVDNDLKPHIVMYHRKSPSNKPAWAKMADGAYFHYYKKKDVWQENELPFIGNRPKLVSDRKDNLYLVFIRKDHFDAKDQGAPLVIVKATAKTEWKDWKEVYVSKEKYFNEPQLDLPRWTKDNVLSIMVQDVPDREGSSSNIKVLDIKF